MAQTPMKSKLWQELKIAQEAGSPIVFTKPYVSYTELELQALHNEYIGNTYAAREVAPPPGGSDSAQAVAPEAAPSPISAPDGSVTPAPGAAQSGPPLSERQAWMRDHPEVWRDHAPEELARLLGVPFKNLPERRAGLTFNTHGPNDPVRVDAQGRVWYMDEVMKPAIPMPRMVRKVRQQSNNVIEHRTTRPDGGLDEIFEIAGQEQHEIETKHTLPSYQVGIYRDPRLPFKVNIYDGARGFDRMDIVRFYGGVDLVPSTIGKVYIFGVLSYDINQTRDTMERELREKTLGRSNF